MKPRVQNITAAFRAASTSERAEGINWYGRALNLATELDPADPARGAAVIAVLSPMLSWPRNMLLARQAYAMSAGYVGVGNPFASPEMQALNLGCLKKNATKAFRILAGIPAETVVSGEKVTSFYSNILGVAENVTVDRHAIDIACGKPLSDAERSKVIGGKAGYDNVAAMYRRAAEILSSEMKFYITPAQVQAVTWVYWRRNKAVAFHK